jgi:transcriptional regulator with XRE-family HTH domain
VPSLETLERFAGALEVPLYWLFRDGDDQPASPATSSPRSLEELAEEPGPSGREARYLLEARGLLGRIKRKDKDFLLELAGKLAARR